MTKKEMKKQIKQQHELIKQAALSIKMLMRDNKNLEEELAYYKDFASDMIVRVREHD